MGGGSASLRRRAGFTLVELLIVTVIIGILAMLVAAGYRRVLVKAEVSAVAAESRQLYNALQEFYLDNNMYPNATSNPAFQLDTFDPLRSQGYYSGDLVGRLQNGRADGYDSPDDRGVNQEFWVQMTLKVDPSLRFVVASSDDAPLAGGHWLEGVFMYKNGILQQSFLSN